MTQRENPVKLHLRIKELEAENERLKQPCKGMNHEDFCFAMMTLCAVTFLFLWGIK